MKEAFKDHFSTVASNYATFRPDYPPELFSWQATLPKDRACAWDCATGNGQAAIGLADFFEKVVATDASASQIGNAAPHPRVQYSVAPAENSGLSSQSVDLLTVAQSLHWFDFDRFYAEANRVLRPGGAIAVWCYAGIEFEDVGIQDLMANFYHNIVGPYWPPERRYVDQHYRNVPFPFAVRTGPPFSMQADFTLEHLLGYLRTWSATQRFIKAKGFDPVSELGDGLQKVWLVDRPRTRWPIYLRAGIKI